MHKKSIIMAMILAIFFFGCSDMAGRIIEDEEAQEQATLIVIKMGAREFAKQLCERQDCSANLQQMIIASEAIIKEAQLGNTAMIMMGQNYLLSLCKDEHMKDDLSDLFEIMQLSMVPPDLSDTNNEAISIYLRRMEYALRGFRQGLEKKLESA